MVSDASAEKPANIDTESGIDALIHGVSHLAWLAYLNGDAAHGFVSELGDRYAFIRIGDISAPCTISPADGRRAAPAARRRRFSR